MRYTAALLIVLAMTGCQTYWGYSGTGTAVEVIEPPPEMLAQGKAAMPRTRVAVGGDEAVVVTLEVEYFMGLTVREFVENRGNKSIEYTPGMVGLTNKQGKAVVLFDAAKMKGDPVVLGTGERHDATYRFDLQDAVTGSLWWVDSHPDVRALNFSDRGLTIDGTATPVEVPLRIHRRADQDWPTVE